MGNSSSSKKKQAKKEIDRPHSKSKIRRCLVPWSCNKGSNLEGERNFEDEKTDQLYALPNTDAISLNHSSLNEQVDILGKLMDFGIHYIYPEMELQRVSRFVEELRNAGFDMNDELLSYLLLSGFVNSNWKFIIRKFQSSNDKITYETLEKWLIEYGDRNRLKFEEDVYGPRSNMEITICKIGKSGYYRKRIQKLKTNL